MAKYFCHHLLVQECEMNASSEVHGLDRAYDAIAFSGFKSQGEVLQRAPLLFIASENGIPRRISGAM
eukprot:CAMPEP_0195088048 /NCGR_PEP_ID=MMETSP0448-20130528/27719_1 /TAXON_ID=66468 /ORGANISM="Heterocapsa triquestra, Strain CCMP 448" /LENGTH=66 /DNA_ID=CAMNT_0040121661 /DNA_START=24 /DNA_END=224 /DNA_ORIENTATION=+